MRIVAVWEKLNTVAEEIQALHNMKFVKSININKASGNIAKIIKVNGVEY